MPSAPESVETTALSRELSEFLVELSTALHKYSMYPDGHPLIETAVTGVARRLTPILAERPTFAIGVARDHLMIDGVASDATLGVLRELAAKLYRREIGGVRILVGVEDAELTSMLKVVARDGAKPRAGAAPRAADDRDRTGPVLAARDWPHIRLLPLSYDQLALEDGTAKPGDEDRGSPASQLWTRLARSAVAGEHGGSTGAPEALTDPLSFAEMIATRANDPTFDQGIFNLFGSFADEIRMKGAAAAKGMRRKVSSLVQAMSPEALQRVLKLDNGWALQKQLLQNASHALAADTVLDLAKAVAAATQHTMSEALLLLLAKLSKHSDKGSAARKDKADAALRENVRQLISDWDNAAQMPEDNYWQTLEKLIAEPAKGAASTGTYEVPPESVLQLSLETEVFALTARAAVAEMVRRGEIAQLLAMVDATPDANKVVWTLRRHLDNTGTIRRLLRDKPIDFDVLHRLVSRVGFPAASALLDALEKEDDRTSRWKLFEMLAELGPKVGDAVVARLPKAPWFVQRNLLLLMGRLHDWPAGFTPQTYAMHADARVRREAYALLLHDPRTCDRAIVDAVADGDERIVRAGLNSALERGCPKDAVAVLTARLSARSLDGMLGVLAVKALTPVHLKPVLECLIASTLAPRRRFQFRRRLATKSPTSLAALSVLATVWLKDPAALKVLAIAMRDPDPEVQAALRGSKPT